MTKPVKVSFEGDESDLVRSLDKAGAGLDDFAADAKAAGDKAESSLAGVGDKADAVGSATSQAAGGLGDLGGALALMPGPLGAVGGGMEALAPAVMGVTGAADLLNLATTKFPALAKAQTVATNVLAGAQRALNAVMAGNPIALVVLAIVALIAIFVVLYQRNEAFRELVNRVFGALKDRVSEAVEKVGAFAGSVRDKLSAAGERFGDLRTAATNAIGSYTNGGGGVLGKVHGIVEAVTSLPGTIREKAAGVFGPVRDAADNAIGAYRDGGGGVLGKLHGIVEAITGLGGTITTKAAGMWDGLGTSFKGVINRMIGWWNNLSFSIDIPDKIPGLPDSFSITTPNIPYLAEGGVVTRATLAVVGEAGPEAVIPLDRLSQFAGGTTRVVVELSAEQLSDLMLGRRIVGAVDAYVGAGGRRAA
jgi:phage-related protein